MTPPPTLEEVRPEAVRAWNRVRAVLPPSDPLDADDPSVNLDTLMAMLHASLTMDATLTGASHVDWFNLGHFFADRLVALWHEGAFDPDDCSLARYMGLTEDEYAAWVECRYHDLAMALREREA